MDSNNIHLNSDSLLIDDSTSRFSSAIWYKNAQDKVIILAGIGGIGSWLTLLLARMKPKSLFIYDDDVVETANMSGQLYSRKDIGITKVSALTRTVSNYANYNSVFAINEKFTLNCEAADIMICGFDTMLARRVFFNKWKEHVLKKSYEERAHCLFIDGRLNAEEFQILSIQGDDDFNIKKYETEYLFSDADVESSICSYKQTTFCASMIASFMANILVNFCANEEGAYRDIPFFVSYNAETMYLKNKS